MKKVFLYHISTPFKRAMGSIFSNSLKQFVKKKRGKVKENKRVNTELKKEEG